MVVVEPMEYYAGKSKWDDTIRPQAKSESDQKPIYYNEDPAKIPPTSGIIDQRREYVNQVRFINYKSTKINIFYRKRSINISMIVLVVSIIIQIQLHHLLYQNKRLYMKIQLIQSFNVLLMKRENCLISIIP